MPSFIVKEFKNELLKLILTDNDIIYNLTDEEICTIKKIADEKFSSWEWNYGNNPEFEIIKSQRFDGGKLEIRMNVKNGIIKNIKLCGDFFSFGNVLTLQSALTEVKYHLNDINNALNEKGIDLDHFFDRIGKDEFLELLMR